MKHHSVMPGFVEAPVALHGVPDYPELAADESMPIRFIGHDDQEAPTRRQPQAHARFR
ncbi:MULTISPECIES: hypothetical protein [Sorangium]|uniref:hypothetical protein n=1 Tax=Sorangium TaxID=39643 RepID=UPI003D9C551E